jgi:hypothetical protein
MINFFQLFHRLQRQIGNENKAVNIDIIETTRIEKPIIMTETKQPNIKQIIDDIPATYQKEAKNLLDRLKSTDLTWDNLGSVSINKEKLKGPIYQTF